MIDALYIGATGMSAQQTAVDVISNNLANMNTPTFKKGRVSFEDLVYRTVVPRNILENAEDAQSKSGTGVALGGINKVFSMGELKKTDNSFDIAIKGQGFIEVLMPDGNTAYTRAGSLEVTRDGMLATTGGYPLRQMLHIPQDAKDIVIGADGTVQAIVPNEKVPVEIGQIDLSIFANPGGLNPVGDNLYYATERSGTATVARPGEANAGLLSQGYLESSNVKLVEEMVNLMLAQRAYEVNAKVVQAADDLLAMSNNLRK